MVKKSSLRLYIDRSSRLKQYFLRGHNAWFALAFSLLNFTLIFYKLFLESLDFIPEEFKSYAIFVIIFGITYFPLSTILGYLDLKKGTFNAEQKLSREISPIWKELFSRIENLENNGEKIVELLEQLESADKVT
ncbi:MAG: hypothetical protein HeimC3_20790 [Candidatus Heimdallarchaeota archaeon LC_3]|nr:MAG: hypothetical protein HeimC3_20790 [Candidatus Heimdallarchaeota archaeon LC_3]